MFVFAIETNGKTVAFTKEADRVMLNGILTGDRAEGQRLRDRFLFIEEVTGLKTWDGVSAFTARMATEAEEADYEITEYEHLCSEVDDNIITLPLFDGAVFVPIYLHRRNFGTMLKSTEQAA